MLYEKYPEIQKQYGFPNIIVEQTKDDVGQEVIKAYAEGIKGTWYYYLEGRKRVNVEKIKRQYLTTQRLRAIPRLPPRTRYRKKSV